MDITHPTDQSDIKWVQSDGKTKSGQPVFYVRPRAECINRSHRCVGRRQLGKCIMRNFYPKIILYEINGWTIGSNSKENALKEFWLVCEKSLVNKQLEVKQIK